MLIRAMPLTILRIALSLALALGVCSWLNSAALRLDIPWIFPTKAATADGGATLFPGFVAAILCAAVPPFASGKHTIALIKKSLSIAWRRAERQHGKHGCQTDQGKSHGFLLSVPSALENITPV